MWDPIPVDIIFVAIAAAESTFSAGVLVSTMVELCCLGMDYNHDHADVGADDEDCVNGSVIPC